MMPLSLTDYVAPVSASIVMFAFLLMVRRSVLHLIAAKARLTAARWDDLVMPVIRAPSYLWCLIGALAIGLEFSAMPEKYRSSFHLLIQIALILSITMAVANLVVAAVRNALARFKSPALNSGLVYGIARAIVYTVGGISVLGKLGIEITPLLTAFGLAGLTVALAFKDTLENTFSGIYLLLDSAIEVGDHITLEGGQQGVIEDIGWRTTKLAMATGDTLIMPNLKLAQGIIVRRKRGAY